MSIIKTAMIQMKVVEDKLKNVERVGEYLKQLESEKIDLAILPEMFCCPYQTTKFPVYAEEEGGICWQQLSDFAAYYKIYLVAGSMPEKDEKDHVFNTSYVFDRQGHQIAKHRKMHLFDINVTGGQSFKESDTLTPGDQVTVFDTEFGKMGLCICYDFRFPELARLMVNKGAKVIIVPGAFNMTTGPAHWETLFRQRAVDNQVFTIGVAPSRDPASGYISWGHSIAAAPWGNVLVQLDEKEGCAVETLDLMQVDKVRRELPLLEHRRLDIYTLNENRT